jgi:hypothetical protein
VPIKNICEEKSAVWTGLDIIFVTYSSLVIVVLIILQYCVVYYIKLLWIEYIWIAVHQRNKYIDIKYRFVNRKHMAKMAREYSKRVIIEIIRPNRGSL